jgi:hypothetical protein
LKNTDQAARGAVPAQRYNPHKQTVLKKVHGFIRFFLFFAMKTVGFSAFFHGFFPSLIPLNPKTRIWDCTISSMEKTEI